MRIHELIEARSHSEQNPRIMIRDYIEQRYQAALDNNNIIADVVNLFVNFTPIEKLGIHPQAPNTLDELPIGIWAYPAKLILDSPNYRWLYAAKMPWANVFELQGNAINLDTITTNEQERLIVQARDIITSSRIPLTRDDQYWLNNELIFNVSSEWWSLLIDLASRFKQHLGTNNSQVATNKLHRLLGINAVIDPGYYLITDDIQGQAVIFKRSAIIANQQLTNIHNRSHEWSKTYDLNEKIRVMINQFILVFGQSIRDLGAIQSSQFTQAVNDVVNFLQHERNTRTVISATSPSQWAASISKYVRAMPSVIALSGQDASKFLTVFKKVLRFIMTSYG